MNYLNLFQMLFDGDGDYIPPGRRPLSAAGRMLEHLDKAESAVTGEEHITDELRAALRRAEIKSERASQE